MLNYFFNFWKGWFTLIGLRFYNSYNWFIIVVWYSILVNMYLIYVNLCIYSVVGYEYLNLILRFYFRVFYFVVIYCVYKVTWDKNISYFFFFSMKNKIEMKNVFFFGLSRKYNFNSYEKKKRKIKYYLIIR